MSGNGAVNFRKRRYYLVISATIILFLAGYWLYAHYNIAKKAEAEPITHVEAVDLEPVVLEWIPELPVRLVIPVIKVDAAVQYVGLTKEGVGEMAVPSNFTDVGWYKHGVRPGMQGSAVIAGHYNGKDVTEGVFYNLHTLKIGDEVVIMSTERIEDIFSVVKIETYHYDEETTNVFVSVDGKARLNLVTCAGDWLSEEKLFNKRTVVFTEQLTDVE